jgi:hypothetical protein
MRAIRLVILVGMWICSMSVVWADGMPIAPPSLMRFFAEQTQIALIEVKRDKTVTVDLFISLQDSSGKSNQLYHLLPLQTVPQDFRVVEKTLPQFKEQKLSGIDAKFRESVEQKEAQKRSSYNSFITGSLLAGPVALYISGPVWQQQHRPNNIIGDEAYGGMPHQGAPGALGPMPVLTATTTHAVAQVYAALKPEEIARLTQTATLPEAVNAALRQYAGRPFALMKLQTIPSPPRKTGEQLRAEFETGWKEARRTQQRFDIERFQRREEPQPGLHISFSQPMQKTAAGNEYIYPLGTGQGWAKPIPETRIYVWAEEDLPVAVNYPEIISKKVTDWHFYQAMARSSTTKFACNGRQLQSATYNNSNAKEDVRIVLKERGPNMFAAERRRWWAGFVGMPVLGLGLWLGAFWLVTIWYGYRKEKGYWRTLGEGWLTLQMVLLPLTGITWLVSGPMRLHGIFRYIGLSDDMANQLVPFLALLLCLLAVGYIYLLVRILAKPQWRGLLGWSLVASLLAAIIYLPVSWKILAGLGG